MLKKVLTLIKSNKLLKWALSIIPCAIYSRCIKDNRYGVKKMEDRLIDIEMALAVLQKNFDELNSVVIEQSKQIAHLQKLNRYILDNMDKDVVKPLSEETPPPHY